MYISRTFYNSGFPKDPSNGPLVSVVPPYTPDLTSIFPSSPRSALSANQSLKDSTFITFQCLFS